MDIETLAGKVDTLIESVHTLTTGLTTFTESLKPAVITPEENDLAAVAEAAVKAGLPEGSRKVVYEAVKSGTKPEDAIASQKALVDDITKQVQESLKVAGTGRVVEGIAVAVPMHEMAGIKVGA